MTGPCHIVVPPRPHLRKWVDRLRLQVDMEEAGTVFTIFCVVEREHCPAVIDRAAAARMMPQAAGILVVVRLGVQVAAVGERAPVLRVPADTRRLPPTRWEPGLMPRNRVLVALSFHKVATPVAMVAKWLRGSLPDPEPSGLELLRLEYELPPATRERAAEKEAVKALRKAAAAMGIAMTHAHRLQQVQVAHGAVFALLAVPRSEATRWLRASGCNGVFLRPFWTKDTSPGLDRNRFNLLWLRGRRDAAGKVWDAVHDMESVWGLLVADRDAAIRVCNVAQQSELQARVKLALGDRHTTFHQATPDLHWWRLGPLEDADVFQLDAIIAKTGLTHHRDLRLGSAGRFRRVAFFAARGSRLGRRWMMADGEGVAVRD